MINRFMHTIEDGQKMMDMHFTAIGEQRSLDLGLGKNHRNFNFKMDCWICFDNQTSLILIKNDWNLPHTCFTSQKDHPLVSGSIATPISSPRLWRLPSVPWIRAMHHPPGPSLLCPEPHQVTRHLCAGFNFSVFWGAVPVIAGIYPLAIYPLVN